jgi:hypothetical protein
LRREIRVGSTGFIELLESSFPTALSIFLFASLRPFDIALLPGSGGADFKKEPGAGVNPIVLGAGNSNAKRFGGLGIGHADEVAEFH